MVSPDRAQSEGGNLEELLEQNRDFQFSGKLGVSPRQRKITLVGGFANWMKAKTEGTLGEKAVA